MPRGFAGAKKDENHDEIAEALKAIPGVTVQSLHAVGGGCTDLLVGVAGRNLLIEVKPGPGLTKDKRRWVLNATQEDWHRAWTGQKCVVWTAAEAVAVVIAAMREAA
jgi:hypothetical protein